MEDRRIIELFFRRDQSAIAAAKEKYDKVCLAALRRVLTDSRDIEECLGDVFLRLWNAIPPAQPDSLKAYCIKVARNLALDRCEKNGKTALTEAFDELSDFLPDRLQSVEKAADADMFKEFLNSFLRKQSREARIFFIKRYLYGESIREIALECRCGESKVKSSLFRTRLNLKNAMEKEGLSI